MPPILRPVLLLLPCSLLTSCGTASHYLGAAGGLVNSITSPILGTLRLSDSPESTPPSEAPLPESHDSRSTPAERPH